MDQVSRYSFEEIKQAILFELYNTCSLMDLSIEEKERYYYIVGVIGLRKGGLLKLTKI